MADNCGSVPIMSSEMSMMFIVALLSARQARARPLAAVLPRRPGSGSRRHRRERFATVSVEELSDFHTHAKIRVLSGV